MQKNESSLDRVLRGIVGVGLVYFGLTFPTPWNWVSIGVGAILVVTGAIGFCPLYFLFKVKTN